MFVYQRVKSSMINASFFGSRWVSSTETLSWILQGDSWTPCRTGSESVHTSMRAGQEASRHMSYWFGMLTHLRSKHRNAMEFLTQWWGKDNLEHPGNILEIRVACNLLCIISSYSVIGLNCILLRVSHAKPRAHLSELPSNGKSDWSFDFAPLNAHSPGASEKWRGSPRKVGSWVGAHFLGYQPMTDASMHRALFAWKRLV